MCSWCCVEASVRTLQCFLGRKIKKPFRNNKVMNFILCITVLVVNFHKFRKLRTGCFSNDSETKMSWSIPGEIKKTIF